MTSAVFKGTNRGIPSWTVAAALALPLAALGPGALSRVPARPALQGQRPPVQREAAPTSLKRAVFLVPVSERASWRDDLFLATVPAATLACGKPVVCAVDPESPWRPELLDYLRRYRPQRVFWVGPEPPAGAPQSVALQTMPAATAEDAARLLATAFWRKAPTAVAYDRSERTSALAAAVLSARLRVPLFPCSGGLSDAVREALSRLGASSLLVVGGLRTDSPADRGFRYERLPDGLAVAGWLARHRLRVDYLSLVHPLDGGSNASPRLSLAGVLLASGHDGVVVPLPFETVWKRRFPAGDTVAATPAGVEPSKAGYRSGTLHLGGTDCRFLVGQDPQTERWWVQIDQNGDDRYEGDGERPLRTGDAVRLGTTNYVVDLDAVEGERGRALWLTSPTPADIVGHLALYRKAVGRDPRYLCVVGWPDAVPLAITGDAQGTDADLVTDHPYAQTDADPFVDLAFARFIAEDAASGTLEACRSLTIRDIRDASVSSTYATAEWVLRSGNPLELAGLRHMGHHNGPKPVGALSPLTRVGAIDHSSHAIWTAMGSTYTWDSDVLLAPCIVVSGGCSTAALDQDPKRRSVAARLLRNGAVAYAGNGRRGTAQSALYLSELWNALLRGQTLGEANRSALNRSLLAILERGEGRDGAYRYEQDHVAAYGDPAMDPGFPKAPESAWARVAVRGSRVEVLAPDKWARTEYEPLAEWKCRYPKLWTWNGLGVGTEAPWRGGDNHDLHDLLFTAEVRTKRPFVGVEPIDGTQPPLGWTGSCFVDEHSDGTRSLYRRCRLIHFDMTKGEVLGRADKLTFRLVDKQRSQRKH